MEKEIWTPLDLRPTLYEISSFGKIRSMDRISKTYGSIIKGQHLKPYTDRKGYNCIKIYINGKRIAQKIHRLVAIHFIFNPDNKPCVNHLDLNKRNNCVSNLEWCTSKENTHHAQLNGAIKMGSKPYVFKGRPKGRRIILDINTGVFYDHPTELSNLYGIKKKEIYRQLNGERTNKTSFRYV